ncbi:cysteine hydrolase family protein [Ancylobacter amanitiformis]|uniref:Nicotinamidase-related amidase n=1 Tax=Ancylobacter amanitiformis TaxID=217069 RepID=A0ABU0LKB2_9HYPH|nr:cysteine hydrolase [Ancylobacter amanitiformis]MDQ0509140.1 nicotinamidase-related amidase [Ancylobacter amanitiformis]
MSLDIAGDDMAGDMAVAPRRPGPHAVHLCIDMQRLFSETTPWHTPAMADVLPNILRIAEAKPGRSLFARFIVADSAETAPGCWQPYYLRWSTLTLEQMDPLLHELVAPLTAHAAPDRVFDKAGYSIFANPGFSDWLAANAVDTLVFTGVETDICVLASLFDALDRGFHAIVVTDAVTSSAPASHEAVMTHLLPRMPEQVALMDTATLLALWTD